MPMDPTGQGALPGNAAVTKPKSPFASLLAGSVSGIGEGMMRGPFRAAYNAGQGGVFSPFQAAHLGKTIQQSAQNKILNQQKLQNDFDEFDRMQMAQSPQGQPPATSMTPHVKPGGMNEY